MTEEAVQLDARGLMCPIPVLRTKKAVNLLQPGEVLEILSSDAGSSRDVDAFCQQTGNQFLSAETRDDFFVIRIRKG